MISVLLVLLSLGAAQQPAPPPGAQPARVAVTVVDQTGAVIPNADVTVASMDVAANTAPVQKTNDKGVATVSVVPGRYSIAAAFPGFETKTLKDIRLRPGDNKHVIVLPIQGLQDSVTVSRDAREAASDRRATFGTALTREQIEALSDDPDEMAQQLQDMAGGGATIRVDSFEGGRLPPKAMIKSIHITRDAFAAENHFAGGLFIDIITQPGVGPLRTNFNTRLRDGSLSGRPPNTISTDRKGPERTQGYNGGLGGSLIKQKASFNVNVNSNMSFVTPYFHYTGPDLVEVTSLAPRRRDDNVFVFGNFDYALTKDQTLRVNYQEIRFDTKSAGIGGLDTLQRGYSTSDHTHTLRLQEAGPLGRRFFTNTRGFVNWSNGDSHSVFEAPTIQVLDTFNAGGAQQQGGTQSKTISLMSDLDYVRGMNSVRTGIQIDGGSYHSNRSSNYLGTYVFQTIDDYLAGRPLSYTIRKGDPVIQYWNLQAGLYVQDDIRVRKNLTLSPGVRYEAQTHLSDYNNFGPRFGITYSPGKSGKTTLRASAGIFYDWLFSSTYEQTLRVNGVRQQELIVPSPTYPISETSLGLTAATSKYLLGDGLQMQQNTRYSAGFSRQVTRMVQVNTTYAHTRGAHLMRGENLNAPAPGTFIRPDPNFANVVEVIGDARSLQDTLNFGAVVNFNVPKAGAAAGSAGGPVMINNGNMVMVVGGPPPPPPPPGSKPTPANARWNWRRMNLFTNLAFGRQLNDTDGAFNTPAT